jgi:hypothetical protein
VELQLDSSLQGKTLKLVFAGGQGQPSEFHLEIWKMRRTNQEESELRVSRVIEPEAAFGANTTLIVEIDNIDQDEFDGLGLIITRTDPYEEMEGAGMYSVQFMTK